MARRASKAAEVHAINPRQQSTSRRKIRIDDLRTIDPLTKNQERFFEAYKNGSELMVLHGVAGTGKSFIALYKAIEEVLDKGKHFDKLIIVRSAVQSREVGHLPGDLEEKLEQYQLPYKAIMNNLFSGVSEVYDKLTTQGVIEFASTSFVRGMTFDDSIVIVDECQNLSWEELDTIITRIGDRSKIVFCGDYRQTDLKKAGDKSGLFKFLNILNGMSGHTRIEFHVDDIVRSDLVKQYILARMDYEDKENKK